MALLQNEEYVFPVLYLQEWMGKSVVPIQEAVS